MYTAKRYVGSWRVKLERKFLVRMQTEGDFQGIIDRVKKLGEKKGVTVEEGRLYTGRTEL